MRLGISTRSRQVRSMTNFPNYIFFGSDEFSVTILDELLKADHPPSFIVTTPDETPVKLWAEQNKIPYAQPIDLRSYKLEASTYQLFLVASYGKIIPKEILDLPTHGTLNIHPSLLPAYRGSTPIQTAILDGVSESGVSLMLLDEKMDHGPILEARSYNLEAVTFRAARYDMAKIGAELFLKVAPKWVAGEIKATPQDHSLATYTKKIKKEDGLIDLKDDPKLNYRKFLAYLGWSGSYFFTERNRKKVRVIITAANIENGEFTLHRVKPEGKKEMTWEAFQHGFKFN